MKAVITNIDYSTAGKELVVNLYGRGEDGKRITHQLKNTQPHFYMLGSEPAPKMPEVTSVESGYTSLYGDQLKRINVRYPFDVPKVREGLTHFEADIIYQYRVRYDYGIKGQVEINGENIKPVDSVGDVVPKFCCLDIEVDNSHGGWTADVAQGEILSMSLHDSDKDIIYLLLNLSPHPMRHNFLENTTVTTTMAEILQKHGYKYQVKVIVCNSEYDLLTKFKSYLAGPHAPDILVAWNGWEYDFPYIEARMKANKMMMPKGFTCFDMMWGYGVLYRTQHGELESRALQSCASKELGIGKLDLGKPIFEAYRNDVALFMAYNVIDVVLMLEMEKKINIIRHYQTLSEVAGVSLDDVNMETRMVESMMFYMLRGKRIILPSISGKMKGSEYKSKGAEVLEPSNGIFKNVAVFDLKGEYPNIMRSFNLSPETLVENPKPGGDYYTMPIAGIRTLKTPRGLIPQILDNMMAMRDAMKAEMAKYPKGSPDYDNFYRRQEAFKWVMNSVAGVLGNEHFRLADRRMFNNVTGTARLHLQWIAEKAKVMGYKVLYGDTDSCMIEMPDEKREDIIRKAQDINVTLNGTFAEFIKQFNAKASTLKVDFKKLYSKWFQGGKKKRYAGVTVWDGGKFVDPQIEITGFDAKRCSTPIWTRTIQKELLWTVLTEEPEKVEKYIRAKFNELKSGKVPPEEIGIPVGIGQDEYTNNAIQSRAIMYSNANLGKDFGKGSKIRYYYVKGVKGKPTTDVMAIDVDDKFPSDIVTIDMQEHIRRCFELPLGPILNAIGLKVSDIMGATSTTSLMDFAKK